MRKLFAIILLSVAAFAQRPLASTTLASTGNSNLTLQNSITLTSISNIKSGFILYVDQEAMTVVSTNPLTQVAMVQRGVLGTAATAHAAGTTVYYGPPSDFFSRDPAGGCSAATAPVTPWLNVLNSNQWTCVNSTWTLTSSTVTIPGAPGPPGPTGPSSAAAKIASQFNWQQSPTVPASLSIGSNTITLSPCPNGFFINTNNDYVVTQYVYIAGTGSPEADLATRVSGHAGDASCQFSVTARNNHSAGYTVSSASGGIKECSEAARLPLDSIGYSRTQGGACVIDPAGTPYKVYAPLHFEASYQHIYGAGGLIQCWVAASIAWTQDDDCIVVGQRASQTTTVYVDIDGIQIQPSNGNTTNYAFDAINVNAQGTHLHNVSFQFGGSSLGNFPVNPGSFNSYVSVCDDEAFTLDVIANLNGQGLRSDGIGQAIYGLAQGDHTHGNVNGCFGVGWLNNINGSMQCAGNVINWLSGNGLRVSNSVVQGFSQFGIRSGKAFGGFNPATQIDNAYFEVGGCTNPDYVAAGAVGLAARAEAGVIMNGGHVSGQGSTGFTGNVPQFACSGSAGATAFQYWIIATQTGGSSGNGDSAPLLAGNVASSCSGTASIMWPKIVPGSGGTVTYSILRTTGAPPTVPYAGGCAGGSPTACGSVVTGQSDTGAAIQTFTDTVANNTTLYTFGSYNFVVYLPFWPGNLVLSASQPTDRTQLPIAFFTGEQNLGGGAVNGGVVSSNGNESPSTFSLAGTGQTQSGSGQNGPAGGAVDVHLGGFNTATLLMTASQAQQETSNTKGRLNFPGTTLVGIPAGSRITLADSTPDQTIATSTNRPQMDTTDVWIGFDTNSSRSATGYADGSPISISHYINSLPDGTSWLERLTSTLKTFTVPVQAAGGSASKCVCWRGDGKTLGFCSTQPDTSGSCTCN